MKYIILTIVIVGMLSCKSKKGTTSSVDLKKQTWEVISLQGEKSKSIQTLSVSDEKISGQAACNKYSGTVKLGEKGTVNFSGIFGTKMGCELLDEEQLFFELLDKTSSFKILNDEELMLYNSDNKVLVKLKNKI